MRHCSITDLQEQFADDDIEHLEALDTGAVTVELGKYPAGNTTERVSHAADEIYYILSGEGTIRLGEETRSLTDGDMIHVEAAIEHEFVEIEQDILALIIFGPAITSSSYAASNDES